jgi:hypothetical protein
MARPAEVISGSLPGWFLEAFFMRSHRTPSLRRHKASALGVVTLSGKEVYLGHWPTGQKNPPAAVRAEYDRHIAEWLANGRQLLPSTATNPDGIIVNELILAFYQYAEVYYRRADRTSTNELGEYRYSLRPLKELYGGLPVNEFRPLKLEAVRQRMLDAGWCRTVINRRVWRIVRMFKWGVSKELVTESVYNALATVGSLAKGRTDAKESAPVKPVPEAHVMAILPQVLPPVAAMLELQLVTGMRPGEARISSHSGLPRDTNVRGEWAHRSWRFPPVTYSRVVIVFLPPHGGRGLTWGSYLDQRAYGPVLQPDSGVKN